MSAGSGHLHQATAIAIGHRALLIEGPPGSGKTTLAMMLIDRGATLIGDDGIYIRSEAGIVQAAPPAATAGLIEIRGIGLASLATTTAPVALILRAHDDPPRYVEEVATIRLAGCMIPVLPFDLQAPAAALRAEYALELHGLSPGATV